MGTGSRAIASECSSLIASTLSVDAWFRANPSSPVHKLSHAGNSFRFLEEALIIKRSRSFLRRM